MKIALPGLFRPGSAVLQGHRFALLLALSPGLLVLWEVSMNLDGFPRPDRPLAAAVDHRLHGLFDVLGSILSGAQKQIPPNSASLQLATGIDSDDGPPAPPGGEAGDTNAPPVASSLPESPSVHLLVPVWTNGSLRMGYGGGNPGLPPYDLFLTTNLNAVALAGFQPPRVPWTWVYRTAAGETNWTLFSLPPNQAFFLLGSVEDADGDGMPDAWELLQGLNPFGMDGQGDLDGDGIHNLDEYLFGLNPWLDDTTSGKRQRFTYDALSRLIRSGPNPPIHYSLDEEGNINQIHQ